MSKHIEHFNQKIFPIPTIKQILDQTKSKNPPKMVAIQGWVRSIRKSSQVIFLVINDGSCFSCVQAVVDKTAQPELAAQALKLTTGSSCSLSGIWSLSPAGTEFELQVDKIIIYGLTPPEYPLQKKYHSLEFLREHAHLRARTNTIGAITRIRSQLSYAIHQYFHSLDFTYLHSPIITSLDAEGAGEMFQITTLPLFQNQAHSQATKSYYVEQDFFKKQAYLSVSGQLQAEAFACSLSRVYTFGPTFRAENSNTSRHVAEFWMIEPEMAFCDLTQLLSFIEHFIHFLLQSILTHCSEELQFLHRANPQVYENLQKWSQIPFPIISYSQAVELLSQADVDFEFPLQWGQDLQSEHERYLCQNIYQCPVMITHYPKTIKAFYMKQNDDGKTVDAVDFLVPGVGELIGGSARENDEHKLLEAMEYFQIDKSSYQWYLDLRRYGSVPHAGFGLGLERFLQFISGLNIRDVIAFPRYPGHLQY